MTETSSNMETGKNPSDTNKKETNEIVSTRQKSKEEIRKIEMNEDGDENDDTSRTSSDDSNNDSSSTGSDDSSYSNSAFESDEEFLEEDDIPLFKYARLIGSLPFTTSTDFENKSESNSIKDNFSSLCSATAMGKGSCSPPPATVSSNKASSSFSPSLASSTTVPSLHIGIANPQTTPQEEIYFNVCAYGLQNGTIFLMDVQTGLPLLQPGKALSLVNKQYFTNINTDSNAVVHGKRDTVVSLSFDSSGKYLAAGRINGDVLIFELNYHYAQHTKEIKQENDSLLSSFFGSTTNSANTAKKSSSSDQSSSPIYQRTFDKLNSTDPIKCTYATPISNPILTCLALDPSYSRRREKSHIVGFQDGRVLLTKQGFFGRLANTPLYNGSDPIENIVWRGNLIVWADQSGIKLYDIQQSSRLARIDRPIGARASLYPSISTLKPHLHFETSDNLIMAWGDCVMTLEIVEQPLEAPPTSTNSVDSESISSSTKVARKRKVNCSMAWELDCVACGVQPLDEHHVAILGLVPIQGQNNNVIGNKLELQILSREEGTVMSADVLQLEDQFEKNKQIDQGQNGNKDMEEEHELIPDPASGYSLLSTFGLPRMEDEIELEDEELITPGVISRTPSVMEGDMEKMLNPLGSIGGILPSSLSLSSTSAKFVDSHLRWSINSVTTRSKEIASFIPNDEDEINIMMNKPRRTVAKSKPYNPAQKSTIYSPPPIMIISSPFDSILVRTRNIDDSIAHYRAKALPQLALSLGIQHRQILRVHSLPSLIQEYFTFLLNGGDIKKSHSNSIVHAARMMPMLIGGNIEMWERWITQFAKVDGGLFAIRDFIPVRDPKLSSGTYEMILNKMILEIEKMCGVPGTTEIRIHAAKRFYLSTLMAWGPIPAITERFQLLSHRVRDGGGYIKDRIAIDLFMRMQQTSKRYLKHSALMLPKEQFETWRHTMREGGIIRKNRGSVMPTSKNTQSNSKKENLGSLYDIDAVTSNLTKKLPLHGSDDREQDRQKNDDVTIVLFESVAELQYISRSYHESLRHLLIIGAHFVNEAKVIDLEVEALNSIVLPEQVSMEEAKEDDLYRYEHIFAMIEYHNLHRYLLEDSFISNIILEGNNVSKRIPPIVALFRLVGHILTGNFLIKHCSLPSFNDQNKPAQKQTKKKNHTKIYSNEEFSSSYLPLTDITKQLEHYPRLLLWYLHLVFSKRPELYVNFPNTSVAPTVITDLHQKHFQLLMQYSVEERSEFGGEITIEADSPMMSFLKSVLRHSGVRSEEVRQMLESHRSDKIKNSLISTTSLFARELAYVIERSNLSSEEDAKTIIQLHLEGSKSLPLAVAYAERNTKYSSMLWDKLVKYCLTTKATSKDGSSLFQGLLKAAAQCGADLAHLVSQIPEGMNIDGLRPMLLAAVADYRLKLKMHESCVEIMSDDKVNMIREVTHKTRKGVRAKSVWNEKQKPSQSTILSKSTLVYKDTKIRKNIGRHKLRVQNERQARLRPINLVPIR